jgi:hypothetical protein
MGAFGKARVEQQLAWEYSVNNLIAAYERAFEKKAGRGSSVVKLNSPPGMSHVQGSKEPNASRFEN